MGRGEAISPTEGEQRVRKAKQTLKATLKSKWQRCGRSTDFSFSRRKDDCDWEGGGKGIGEGKRAHGRCLTERRRK
jgi:hypothetical protein